MEEKLVSYNTAELLSDKGFDAYTKNYVAVGNDYNNIRFGYKAPTLSLAQQWLREVHNIHIEVRRIYPQDWFEDYTPEYTPFVYIKPNNYHLEDTLGDEYDTYEGALERGIDVALKLI